MNQITKNMVLEGECLSLTSEGMGVVKVNNFPLFVKDMLPGEIGEIKIVKLKKTFGYARLMKLSKISSKRVEPKCKVYKECGGCQLQHLSYEGQLEYKHDKVVNAFKRIAKIDFEVLPVLGMKEPYYYRHKVQVPVTTKDKKMITGFYRINSHDIIANDECLIESQATTVLLNKIKNIFNENSINIKQIKHVLIKHGYATNELMLVLVVNTEKFRITKKIVKKLVEENKKSSIPEESNEFFNNLKTIILNYKLNDDNVILGEKETIVYGDGYIEDEIDGIKFQISAKSFYQVNPIQVEILYNKALELAQINKSDIVLDCYCGIGTISLLASKYAKKVIGIEIVEQAIVDAKNNAQINNINNVEFIAKDVSKWIETYKEKVNVLIVDPPRKGCEKSFLESVIKLKPEKIVYISCDVATQARDVRFLIDNNYELEVIQPVDMFSHTYHVENIVLMSKLKN